MVEPTSSSPVLVGIEINLALPFPLATADGATYVIDTLTGAVTVTVNKVRQENPDPRLFIEATTSELARDRYGWLSYSNLEIKIDAIAFEGLTRSLGIPNGLDSASAVALNVTNRFISVYRHVVGDAFVTRIDSGQMFLFRAHAKYSDGGIDGLMTSNYPSGITLATIGLVDEIEERFSKVLADGHHLAAWNELMLDAVDALDRNELASAVALGFAAVETGSRAICRAHFRSEGLSISAAQQLAKEWGERGRVAGDSRLASVEELVDRLNVHTVLTGAMTVSSVPIDGWGRELRSVFRLHAEARNTLLHSGVESEHKRIQSYLDNAQWILLELGISGRTPERIDEILNAPAEDPLIVLGERLGHDPIDLLKTQISLISERYSTIQIKSARSSPSRQSGVGVQPQGSSMVLYIPMPYRPSEYDWEVELTRILMVSQLNREGFPFADAITREEGRGLPIDLELYRAIAHDITVSVHGQVVDHKFRQNSVPTNARAEMLRGLLTGIVTEENFIEPDPMQKLFADMALKCIDICSASEDEWELLGPLISEKTPTIYAVVTPVIRLFRVLDLTVKADHAIAILFLKDALLGDGGRISIGTVGVKEGPDWKLRWRMTDEEVTRIPNLEES